MIPRAPTPSALLKKRQQTQPCLVCSGTTKWGNIRRWQQKNKYSAQVEGIGRMDKLNHQYQHNEKRGEKKMGVEQQRVS